MAAFIAEIGETVRFRIYNGPFGIVSEQPAQFERLSDDCVKGTGIVISRTNKEGFNQYELDVVDHIGDVGAHQNGTGGESLWVCEFEIIGIQAREFVAITKRGEEER